MVIIMNIMMAVMMIVWMIMFLMMGKNNFFLRKTQKYQFLPYVKSWEEWIHWLGQGFKIGPNEKWGKIKEIQEIFILVISTLILWLTD